VCFPRGPGSKANVMVRVPSTYPPISLRPLLKYLSGSSPILSWIPPTPYQPRLFRLSMKVVADRHLIHPPSFVLKGTFIREYVPPGPLLKSPPVLQMRPPVNAQNSERMTQHFWQGSSTHIRVVYPHLSVALTWCCHRFTDQVARLVFPRVFKGTF